MTDITDIRYSSVTHVGRVREINEDSLLALPESGVWIVADGMGGHLAGDFASQTITESIAALPTGLGPNDLMHAVREAINRAHAVIQKEAAAHGGKTIGATIASLIIANGHFVSFWAGDSRLYRLRDGTAEILTTDHSIVAGLVLSGQMTWDEAEHHPQSNAITRAVGVGDEFQVDKIRGELAPGDRFLLCTDGLNKYANLRMIEQILTDNPLETVADTLLQTALDGGGADNISIIVIDVP